MDFGHKVALKTVDFLVDFSVDFFLLVFPRKMAPKNPPKNPPPKPNTKIHQKFQGRGVLFLSSSHFLSGFPDCRGFVLFLLLGLLGRLTRSIPERVQDTIRTFTRKTSF